LEEALRWVLFSGRRHLGDEELRKMDSFSLFAFE
jgi:hypothetical protein